MIAWLVYAAWCWLIRRIRPINARSLNAVDSYMEDPCQ